MSVKAKTFNPNINSIQNIEEVIPILIPVSMWEILIYKAEIENCSPGEILDKALCKYLENDLDIFEKYVKQKY